jgi:starch-binding outer membrane protein, SusD/RagB family
MTRYSLRRAARAVGLAGATVLLAAGLFSACKGDPLSAPSPTRVAADGLYVPANAQLLVNGAIGDFECAFNSYTALGALIGDEFNDATQTADRFPYDARTLTRSDRRYAVNSCTSLGAYTPLQASRISADAIRRSLETWTDTDVPNRQALLASTDLVEAYSMLLLSEGFCSTTFTTYDDAQNPVYGTELQPAEAAAMAEARFSAAITAAQASGAGAASTLNAAYVGRARARLDQGNLAGARADAALVPAGFVYNVTASQASTRRTNRVWAENDSIGQSSSVGNYYRNLNDARVPSYYYGKVIRGDSIFIQQKYPTASTPLPLATYREAQLIIAETDVGANPTNAVAIINAERARSRAPGYTGQPDYVGPLDAASLKAEVVNQRRRALWLDSHHLGDVIRYDITLTPAAGTAYRNGGTYGNNVCLPLPDIERLNNPNLQ